MATKYIERFEIPGGASCAISEEGEGAEKKFKPWANGCGIGHAVPTMMEARMMIYAYVTTRLQGNWASLRCKLDEVEASQQKLAGDIFNLSMFKVKVEA